MLSYLPLIEMHCLPNEPKNIAPEKIYLQIIVRSKFRRDLLRGGRIPINQSRMKESTIRRMVHGGKFAG